LHSRGSIGECHRSICLRSQYNYEQYVPPSRWNGRVGNSFSSGETSDSFHSDDANLCYKVLVFQAECFCRHQLQVRYIQHVTRCVSIVRSVDKVRSVVRATIKSCLVRELLNDLLLTVNALEVSLK